MTEFFLNIVNMSISASWIVLAVLLLRLLLKKAPKWITVLLWGIVAARLICPFTIESFMSLIPSAQTISPEIMTDATPEIDSGIPILNNAINTVISDSFTPNPSASANPLQILIPILSVVWVVGIVAMLLYTLISYFKVKCKIGTAVLLRDNILQSENVASPFVLGIVKPKIYLPFNIDNQDLEHVIAHENAHIQRKDHLWKPFGFLLLTLHWFNPLMWLGYVLLCRDIELACDEKVIKELNTAQKADYSQALLTCSVNRHIIAACPLAFGEVGVKSRIKSVLSYKKPAFWIIIAAILTSAVVAACFLTNPTSNRLKNIEGREYNLKAEETTSVWFFDGEAYKNVGAVNENLLQKLFDIKISRKEISLNRSEDRDYTHSLIFQTAKDAEPTIYSHIRGLGVHFNSDFSAVWVSDSVKPSLSYKVINPQKAKQIFDSISGINTDAANKTEMLFGVLNSKTTFINESGKAVYLKNHKLFNLVDAIPEKYTLSDFDGDGKDELVVHVTPNVGGYIVFHIYNNTVYGFDFWERGIISLKTDGTFIQSSGAGLNSYAALSFLKNKYDIIEQAYADDIKNNYRINGVSSTAEIVNKYITEFYNKRDVSWKSYENIKTFEYTLSFANWTDRSEIYFSALNSNKLAISSVRHLPIHKFDTLNDLEQFKKAFSDTFSMDSGYDEVPSFNENIAKYDEAFFKENTLMLIYVSANNCTHRFAVQDVFCDKAFSVEIKETTNAQTVDTAMAGWFITVAVPDSEISDCVEFDAFI